MLTTNNFARNHILEVAIGYIAAGLNITPICSPLSTGSSPGKRPILDDWQNKQLTAQEFQAALPVDGNIGLVTGKSSGIVCIDLDDQEGIAWLHDNEYRLGHFLAERRGSESVHLYYRYPATLTELRSVFLTADRKVQIKADGGQQIVTWPSVHSSGEQYEFDNGLSLLDVAHEADEFPLWLVELVRERGERLVDISTTPSITIVTDHPADIDAAKRALARIKPAIQGQGGDSQTYFAACIARDYGLSRQVAYQLIAEIYNPKCTPPWPDQELRKKISNAYAYANGTRGARSVQVELKALLENDFDKPADPSEVTTLEVETASTSYKTNKPTVAARIFLNRNEDQVLCEDEQLYIYQKEDLRWQPIKDTVFRSVVARDIERLNREDFEALKMEDLSNIVKAIKIDLDNQPRKLRPGTWLDRDDDAGEYVSLKNCILDLTSGEMLPHNPRYFSFTTLPFNYIPGATCPEFLAFLKSVWDDDREMVQALRRWFGYLLLSDTRAQKFAVLIGESRGGKSTLARVMEALIGQDNTAACSLTMFGGQFGLQSIWTKRLAIFNDAQAASGEKGRLAVERIISIVGNDPQPIELKYKDIVSAVLPTKIVFVCNAMPQFINTKGALTNRMIVFPFNKSFAGQEDTQLLTRLIGELPGILNWALEGVREVLAGHMPCSASAGIEAIKSIGEMLDSVQGFIADVVQDSPGSRVVTLKEIWAAYRQWCQDNGIHYPKTKNVMLQELRALLGTRAKEAKTPDKKRLDGFVGISLHEDSVAVDYHSLEEQPPF